MLQCFCGVLYLLLFSCIFRGLLLPGCLPPLGLIWAGQEGRNRRLHKGTNFLHSSCSKDAYTFKASCSPVQEKLASVRNGGEEKPQIHSLSTQWERLWLPTGTQKWVMIPGKLTDLWSTCKRRRHGSWRDHLTLLTGHHFVPSEEFPTASAGDDPFLFLNGMKFKGNRDKERTAVMTTLLMPLSDGIHRIYSSLSSTEQTQPGKR